MKVAVVGAGPAGGFLAWRLALQGHDVHLFEEHPEVGVPVQCTGIVTKAIFELVDKAESDAYIVNLLDKVIVHGKASTVEIPLEEYLMDRDRFDKYLAEKAVSAGARLHLLARFVGVEGNNLLIKNLANNGVVEKHEVDVVVGADGPLSQVAKTAGIFGERRFYYGYEQKLTGTYDTKTFETFFADVPDFFAWAVPENSSIARVGVATKQPVRPYFDAFVKNYPGKMLYHFAGLIPVYDSRLRQQRLDNGVKVFLTGDAAGLVKSTTGGGIITGMISSQILAECIDEERFEEYDSRLRHLKKELALHNLLRNTLNKFTPADYDRLIQLMGKTAVKKILHEHPREYPSRFLLKLLFAEPRLLSFARKVVL